MASFLNRLLNKNNPQMESVQLDEYGNVDIPRSLEVQNMIQPLTLKDRLLGRTLTKDIDIPTDNVDENGQAIMSTQRYSNHRNGLLEDMAKGYNENYNNRFSLDNIGQNKGFGTRLGEGLGTLGRFVDSPLGRFTLAAGLNSALGYKNSLQEGLTAAVGRQNAQTADKVYRQQLSQMGYSDDDLSNIRGNITPEIFKGLTDSFRLGNQRMTYGQLAMFDENIAEQVRNNPELMNQFVPITFAKDIYGKKRELAENKIANDKTKLAQNERRLNILQQRVNQGAATAAEMSEYKKLKMEQIKLENDLYRKELGNGGGGNGRPVGQTKSGIKYEVL